MEESKGYTNIPNSMFDLDLTLQEQSLYIALISFYNKEKGYAFPSYKQLKDRSKIKKDETLIKYINLLIEKKLLIKETVKGRGNKYYIPTPKTEYLQNSSTSENGGTPTPKTEEHALRKRSTTNTNTNTNTNIYSAFDINRLKLSKEKIEEIGMDKLINVINTIKSNNENINDNDLIKSIKIILGIKSTSSKIVKDNKELEIKFEEVWDIYPRKESKKIAEKSFYKLLKQVSYEEIKRSVERYNTLCINENREKKYIKLPTTFFNSGYDDFLDKNTINDEKKTKRIKKTYDGF